MSMTPDVAEDALRSVLGALDAVCERHGLVGVTANQARFVVAIHALGSVAQYSGLTAEYATAKVVEMLPRAMRSAALDAQIDRGQVAP